MVKKKISKKSTGKNDIPDTMKLAHERDIALDFGLKVYREFDNMIKSVIFFGSGAKGKSGSKSDVDILIVIDDVSIRWDMELIAWYREELGKLAQKNNYVRPLHINTIKLTTWWDDMMRGDPVILNVLRYGDAVVDVGSFFKPLQILLAQGKIKPTPEAIYTLLQRSPRHLARARQSLLAAIDGLYWTMIDSAHAALIAANIEPASPEDVAQVLTEVFVKGKMLHKKHVKHYEEIHDIAKEIMHGKQVHISGKQYDDLAEKADSFLQEMAKLVDDILEEQRKQEVH